MFEILLVYMGILSGVGFILMGIDKRRAMKKKWRISEAKLILTALAGGSFGVFLGMNVFHHKTKHRLFTWTVPVAMIFHLLLIGAVFLW